MHIVGFSFGDADFSSHVQHGAEQVSKEPPGIRKDASLIRPFGGTTDGFALRHSPLSSSMSGERCWSTGRTWPRITKDNAAQHPHYYSPSTRVRTDSRCWRRGALAREALLLHQRSRPRRALSIHGLMSRRHALQGPSSAAS